MKKLICLLLPIMLLLSGCAAKEETVGEIPELLEPVGVKVDTAEVRCGDLYSTKIYEGSVVAHAEELSFEIDGSIKEINVYPGMWVEEGDVLLTLDQTALEKSINTLKDQISYTETDGAFGDALAQLDIDMIEVDIERMRAASDSDEQAIALRELDAEQARLDLKQAQELRALSLKDLQAQLEPLEADFGRDTITAPFSGNVFYENNIIEGTGVRAGKAVAYIADPNDLMLTVMEYINERQIEKGRAYALIGEDRFEVEYVPMSREEMASMALAGKKLITRFRIVGPEENMDKVAAGMYAVLCLESSVTEDALMIPLGALYTVSGSSYVYVRTEDGGRERRDVRTGVNNGINVQIVEGLEEGEVVYVKE